MTLDEARTNTGRSVVYQPPGQGIETQEEGVIMAVFARYVFVKYRGDLHAKATAPDLLTFSHPDRGA